MKGINKRLMKTKLKHYKNIKRESKNVNPEKNQGWIKLKKIN